MPRYSYDNVIIIAVTNVVMLEFFSARFVRSGTLQLTILSFLTFFLTKMTSKLSKYLNDQQVVFLNTKQQK